MNDDMVSKILHGLAALPLNQQADAVKELISSVLSNLDEVRVNQIRNEIASELDNSIPIVAEVLDIIDGQLALREIMNSP